VAEKRNRHLIPIRFLLLFLSIFVCHSIGVSQDKLRILNGDLVITNPDQQNESIWLYKNKKGQAKLIQKTTTIEGDSTKYFEARNYAEAKGNVYINQDDSIDIYSKEALYYGNTRKAILQGEVALLKDFYTLQTERLNYNFATKVATYTTGGELTDTSSTLTSKRGTYYVDKAEALFTDSVVLTSPERRIETDKLRYNLEDKWAYFEGETTIYEEDRIIKTTKGRYNTDTGEAELDSPSEIFQDGQVIKTDRGTFNTDTGEALLEGNPEIDDEDKFATAETFILTERNGIGRAIGNVYYKDKKNNSELYADEVEQLNDDEFEAIGSVDLTNWEDSINLKAQYAKVNQLKEEFFATDDVILTILNQDTQLLTDTLEVYQQEGIGKAYGRPFLSTINEGDSIYLIAREMEAVQREFEQDTLYDFIANRDVLLFKSDLQARADSAYVNNIDSTITLFRNPVIWSDSTQMSADTIRIFMKEKEIDKVEFRQNCFFVNLVEEGLFNQLKGKKMYAYFINGEVDSLHTNGNAETIFMVQDDVGAYVAIDEMKAGKMDVKFLAGSVDEIFWYKQQSGVTHPFQDVNPLEFRLPGFVWREDEKPKSKDDLLIAVGRKEGDFELKQLPTFKDVSPRDQSVPTMPSDEPNTPQGIPLKKPKLLKPK